MRAFRLALALAAAGALAACEDGEIENVQAEAENQSRRLENRLAELEREAENRAAAAAGPLENEAEALLNEIAPPEANETGNSAE